MNVSLLKKNVNAKLYGWTPCACVRAVNCTYFLTCFNVAYDCIFLKQRKGYKGLIKYCERRDDTESSCKAWIDEDDTPGQIKLCSYEQKSKL